MRRPLLLALVAQLAVAGCGGDDDAETPAAAGIQPAAAGTQPAATATATRTEAGDSESTAAAAGTRISARGSQFGTMLWGPKRQAIYVFERDARGRSRCYGECAEAWPPVYTRGRPAAGRGVRKSLLGTTRRRDGRMQVTYAGKPLYYYAHEGAGEVRCHNVNLNGGLWWVVGPNGRRRP